MADTAAFFASKKKKKKTFKGFNANKIDAASVTHTVHVDAPALSTDDQNSVMHVATTLTATRLVDAPAVSSGSEQWDDEALAATYSRKGTGGAATAELLDMKALETKRREQDDIAERMRVEETRAALAAAREGMEREAQRLKDAASKARSGDVSAGASAETTSNIGGKWVPPHLRAGSAANLARVRMGGSSSQKLDTQDENLFPDLAAADAILEQQQKHQQAVYKVPKKTPVGGAAAWGSRPPQAAPEKPKPQPSVPQQQAPPLKEQTKPAPPAKEEIKPEPSPAMEVPVQVTPAEVKVAPSVVAKKKKKKDLSTFRATS